MHNPKLPNIWTVLLPTVYSLSQLNSLSLDTGSTAAIKHFGLYCQWLIHLTTKSIYCYLYLHYFHTRFTFITEGIPPLTLSFQFVPLDPLAPKCTFRLTLLHKHQHRYPHYYISNSQCSSYPSAHIPTHRLHNWVPHTSSDSNKYYFSSLYP